MKSGELIKRNEVVEEIRTLHEDFLKSMKQNLERAMRIGELLTTQKDLLEHGEFTPWLKTNVPFSDRTARSYMKVFRNRDLIKTESVSVLGDAYRLLTDQRTLESPALTAARGRVEDALRSYAKVGHSLRVIRDEKLYRDKYDTFEDFCRQRFDLTKKDVLEHLALSERYPKSD